MAGGPKVARAAALAVLVLAALAAYWNTFSVPFVLDDVSSIPDNPTLRQLWPLTAVLHPPGGQGLTVEGRPVLNLSLALNYAVSGERVWSYHAGNLLIHLLAGLTLFGIVRRTGRRSLALAFAVALVWLVHPLQTEAVTYIVQRAESLMGLFYLLTLYAFIRSVEPAGLESAGIGLGPAGWAGLSVGACVLGMATKEVMVSAPVIVFLYDRTFVAGSFAAAWRQRRRYYLCLAATWVVLAALVIGAGNRGGTSGVGSGVGFGQYALTQFPALVHYLRLAVWPHPLVFDYGTPWVTSMAAILPQILVVGVLAGATLWALRRYPAAGFLGVCFFAILAPTSLIPGNRQTLAEHRMYLPLAAVLLVLAAVMARAGARALVGLACALALVFGIVTVRRNHVYRSRLSLYADTAAKAPGNPFAQGNVGLALAAAGQLPEAVLHDEAALALKPDYPVARNNLGNAFLQLGQPEAAAAQFAEAIRLQPSLAAAHDGLATTWLNLGQRGRARAEYQEALRLDPQSAETQNNLGNLLMQEGHSAEALRHYRAALAVAPDYAEARGNLGNALAQSGDIPGAMEQYQQALQANPDFAGAHYNLANALFGLGRTQEAIAHYWAALALKPADAAARGNLGNALAQQGDLPAALEAYRRALRSDPSMAVVHYNFANALLRSGRTDEAIAEYREALRLQPDLSAARQVLRQIDPGGL